MADETLDTSTTSATATADAPSSPPPSSGSSAAPTDIAGETAAAWKQAEAAGSPPAAARETPPPAQPATQADGIAATPAPDGRLPLARHQAILKEAREKADREIAEIRQKFAWAEKVTPQQAEHGIALISWLQRDPAGALDFLQRQHERSQPPAPKADPMPEPDVVLGDGSKFYSADAALKLMEWRERQLEAKITGQFAPMLQNLALKELQAQTTAEATQQLTYYREKFPQFKELEKDIKAACLQNPNLSIEHAYILAYAEKGRAKEREQWDAERAGRLQTKGAATSIAPGTPRPLTPKADRDKSIKEIAREAYQSASA